MKSVSSVLMIYFIVFSFSCEKAESGSRAVHSSTIPSNSFLPAPISTGTQDAITQMKTDPDVRAYASKVPEVLSKAYTICDTVFRNAMIKNQLTPYLEKINTKWAGYLKGRPDRNEIIRGGISGAFPRLPSPASTVGPCEDTRNQEVGRCNRTLAVDAGLCALSWTAGPVAFGTCLVVVGAKSFLCMANADIAYKDCLASIRANIYNDGYRLYDWVWYRNKGWTYSPPLQLNP